MNQISPPRILFAAALLLSCAVSRGEILTSNLLLNAGAEAGDLSHSISEGESNPFVDDGSFNSGLSPRSGNFQFCGGTGNSGSLSQTVSLVGNQGLTAEIIDTGLLMANVSFWMQNLNEGDIGDEAYVRVTCFDFDNQPFPSRTPRMLPLPTDWQKISYASPIPSGTRSIQYTMLFTRHAGDTLDSYIDDNELFISKREPPILTIARTGTELVLSWPREADDFFLEASSGLGNTNWTTVTNFRSVEIDVVAVTDSVTENRFYRLRK